MGEEINKFLHEKLMGGCWHRFDLIDRIGGRSPTVKCSKCMRLEKYADGDNPNYSAEIADAFKAVDAMKEKGFLFAADNRHPEGHWAEFATEDFERGGQATGETFAEAIARAAKDALEGEK